MSTWSRTATNHKLQYGFRLLCLKLQLHGTLQIRLQFCHCNQKCLLCRKKAKKNLL